MASNLPTSNPETVFVFSISAQCLGELMNPRADEVLCGVAARVAGIAHGIGFALAALRAEELYLVALLAHDEVGVRGSLHQKPTGQFVVVETAGFARTTATRFFFFAFVTFGSFKLMAVSSTFEVKRLQAL